MRIVSRHMRFDGLGMLWAWVLILGLAIVAGFEQKFLHAISFDDIQYGAIDIPQSTQSLNLLLWSESNVIKPVFVLIGVGRIPKLTDTENMFEIPPYPSTLQIIQENPPPGKLFLVFWGGKLINSYRYFAGERPISRIGMQYTLNERMLSLTESTISVISHNGLITKRDMVKVNQVPLPAFPIFVPSNVDRLQVFFSLQNISSSNCDFHYSNGDLILSMEAYYDISEELNPFQSKRYSNVRKLKKNDLCDASNISNETSLELSIPFPTSGLWTISTNLLQLNMQESVKRSVDKKNLPHKKMVWNPVVSILNERDNNLFALSSDNSVQTATSIESNSSSIFDANIFEREISCNICSNEYDDRKKVQKMNSVVLHANRQEYVGYNIPIFPSTNMKLSGLYSASIPASPGFMTSNIFAGIIVQLFLKINSHKEEILALVDSLPWQVAIRIGNLPYTIATNSTEEGNVLISDALFAVHRNLCTVSSCTKVDRFQRSTRPSVSNSHYHRLQYDWLWSQPYLSHFNTPGDMMDSSRKIFFHVFLRNVSADILPVESILQELLTQGITIEVQLKLIADACGARNPVPCAHGGECIVTTNAADISGSNSDGKDRLDWIVGDAVITAQCQCRYPWAGEDCRDLAVPSEMYALEVLMLILTNAAMVPAIWFSLHHQLYVVTVGLAASSVSSAIYHLCDTEIYCLMGLSFNSLHVLDVLFSVAMIASTVLFLSPMSRSTHAAACLCTLSLLVAPVIDNPTNALVLILSIVCAIAVVVIRWVVVFRHNHNMFHSKRVPTKSPPNPSSKSTSIYTTIPSSDDQSTDRINPDTEHAGDVEMESMAVLSSGHMHVSDHSSMASHSGLEGSEGVFNPDLTWKNLFYQSSDIFIGALIGLVGISSYALDDRTNYWYLHSLWHIFMMSAAFFLLRGRWHIFNHFKLEHSNYCN